MTVDEIEGCFPERGATTDDDSIICSAQWLHDFAHNVAALEREACAKVCDSLVIDGIKADQTGWCAEIIRERSNAKVSGAGTASAGLPGYAAKGEGDE